MVSNSYILHTTDGGYNWITQRNEGEIFRAVQFLDTSTGFVVGGNTATQFLKTTNGGYNWVNLGNNIATNTYINDLYFVNKDTGWVCSDELFAGGIYRTTNGGLNWTRNFTSINTLKLSFINKDTGWCVTNNSSGYLLRTVNGGVNWSIQYTAPTPINCVFFLNRNQGWIGAGTGNGIMYTTNGGFNFINSQGHPPNYNIGGNIQFINEKTGYAGVDYFYIAKSTDGGKIWGYQNTPYPSRFLLSTIKNDSMNAWGGDLLHTTDGGGPITYTDIEPINSRVADNFKLYQNYPNPFNPNTTIAFYLYNSAYVELKVFNILGKEITTLVNKKQNSGNYEYIFDGSNLPGGIYFYKINLTDKSGNRYSETKRMILIK